MPQVRPARLLSFGLPTLAALFIGCSDPNTQSPINPDTGSHAANWLPTAHVKAAESDINSCTTCHGADYSGGVSGVSCTSCHLGSPTSCHPESWVPIYSTHGPSVITRPTGTSACANQYCHGTTLTGVPDSGPSCTSCHMGGVMNIHPAGWLGDACSNHGGYALANGTAGCSNIYCHGADLTGVSQSGPSCTKCHATIPTSSSCGTCHGIPPDGLAPAGNVYPNIPGKHVKHMALAGVTCETCHSRSCDQHMNGIVDIIFDPACNTETGIASFGTGTGATCTNVSCHGGPRTQRIRTIPPNIYTQVTSSSTWTSDPSYTPDWYNGSSYNYSDTTQCFLCHSYGNTLYNGYFSGQHYFHAIQQGITCISCHDTIKLTNASFHFPDLRSHVISSATASASTNSWLNYNGTTCTNASSGCHAGSTRNWR